jgi:uncharacterized protein (TIGR02246 family)
MLKLYNGKNESRLTSCACIAVLLMVSACNQQAQQPPDTRAADETALRNLDTQWSKAAMANDLDATVSYYSDDAAVFPPNAPVASGKQAIRAVWASLLSPGVSVSWQANKVEVSRASDLAYLTGTYQVTLKDPKGKTSIADSGKFIEVWKKQADGNWKAVADMFNSDLPAAPVPAKKK